MDKSSRKRKAKAGRVRNLKHAVYEEYRDEIVADLISIGARPTARKWNIPPGSIYRLTHIWLTPEQHEMMLKAAGKRGRELTVPKTSSDGRLPPLPFFENSWDPSVQLKWLEVYETLIMRVHDKQ